jgi:hypothetical protein
LSPNRTTAYLLLSEFFNPPAYFHIISCFIQQDSSVNPTAMLQRHLRPIIKPNWQSAERLFVQNTAAVALEGVSHYCLAKLVLGIVLDRKIVVLGRSLTGVSHFCFALLAIVHPLPWSGAFIPVLPVSLVDTLYAPFPFIIGMSSVLADATKSPEMESHLFVDLDKHHVRTVAPEYELTPGATHLISGFEKAVKREGLRKAARDLIFAVVEGVIGSIANPSGLRNWYDAAQKATDPTLRTFENAVLQSRATMSIVNEAEAGPGGELWSYLWGGDGDVAVTRPPPPRQIPFDPKRPELIAEITRLAEKFSQREVAIDAVLEETTRKAQTMKFLFDPDKLNFQSKVERYETPA